MSAPLNISGNDIASLEHGEPLRFVLNGEHDAVLVLAEQYERLKECIKFAATDPESLYPLLADVSPEDWEDLSVYQNA